MRKSLIILAMACILLAGSAYVFIPGILIVSKVKFVHCLPNSVFRILADENKWKTWFPFEKKDSPILVYNEDTFHVGKKVPLTVQVLISRKDNRQLETLITILNLPGDSSIIQWQCELHAGLNPVKRFLQYLYAKSIKNDMKELLDQFAPLIENRDQVYGVHIEITSSSDTILMAKQAILNNYPSTAVEYGLIGEIRKYISRHQSKETGYPIMNIKQLDSGRYSITVAVPMDKTLPDLRQIKKDGFSQQRLVPGHFVTARFTGGDSTIQEVFRQIRFYRLDFSKVPVAIPFQSLITERINEPDTSKWITKIYAPVY